MFLTTRAYQANSPPGLTGGRRRVGLIAASTARTQRRPSSIAQTTRDWPRRASPAAKTLGREVANAGVWMAPRAVVRSWSYSTGPAVSGPESRWRKLAVPDDFHAHVVGTGLRVLGLSPDHGLAVASLPLHHRDPFDRLLVAQARQAGLALVTADTRLHAYADSGKVPPTA
jgi:hypothetical protein